MEKTDDGATHSHITPEMPKSRQRMPLDAKLIMTQRRIREWYEHFDGKAYVSFSGGKDSTVLRDIVKRMYPDVPAVFCDTGLEYPEVRDIALRKSDVILRPKMTFKKVIETYGYPFPSKEQAKYIREYRHTKSDKLRDLRWNGNPSNGNFKISKKWRFLTDAPFEVSEKCCDVMKKEPFHRYEKETGRMPFIATMAEESLLRFQEYIQHGCNAFNNKRAKSTPIGFWTDQDVLCYLAETGIEYAKCYGDITRTKDGKYALTGVSRTGCMFCMFGVHKEGEPNRFQKMQRNYPKQYDYCMGKLGLREVLIYCGIPHEYQETLFDMNN